MIRLTQLEANLTLVETNKGFIWFSYETPIACQRFHSARTITEQKYSPTTSKHQNRLDNPHACACIRVSPENFTSLLEKL